LVRDILFEEILQVAAKQSQKLCTIRVGFLDAPDKAPWFEFAGPRQNKRFIRTKEALWVSSVECFSNRITACQDVEEKKDYEEKLILVETPQKDHEFSCEAEVLEEDFPDT